MKVELSDLTHGVYNKSEELVALTTNETDAKKYAEAIDGFACVVERQDWTSATVQWKAGEALK